MEEFLDQEFINTLAIVNDQSVTYSIDLENMKGVESIAILLSLFLAELQAMGYQCNENIISNCINNPRITVVKSQRSYKVTLHANTQQCYNNFCIMGVHEEETEFMCKNICNSCQLLQPQGENGKNKQTMPIIL